MQQQQQEQQHHGAILLPQQQRQQQLQRQRERRSKPINVSVQGHVVRIIGHVMDSLPNLMQNDHRVRVVVNEDRYIQERPDQELDSFWAFTTLRGDTMRIGASVRAPIKIGPNSLSLEVPGAEDPAAAIPPSVTMYTMGPKFHCVWMDTAAEVNMTTTTVVNDLPPAPGYDNIDDQHITTYLHLRRPSSPPSGPSSEPVTAHWLQIRDPPTEYLNNRGVDEEGGVYVAIKEDDILRPPPAPSPPPPPPPVMLKDSWSNPGSQRVFGAPPGPVVEPSNTEPWAYYIDDTLPHQKYAYVRKQQQPGPAPPPPPEPLVTDPQQQQGPAPPPPPEPLVADPLLTAGLWGADSNRSETTDFYIDEMLENIVGNSADDKAAEDTNNALIDEELLLLSSEQETMVLNEALMDFFDTTCVNLENMEDYWS